MHARRTINVFVFLLHVASLIGFELASVKLMLVVLVVGNVTNFFGFDAFAKQFVFNSVYFGLFITCSPTISNLHLQLSLRILH